MNVKINNLFKMWEQTSSGPLTDEAYIVHLPIDMAARIKALGEMYPNRSINGIITDLISAALNDLEGQFPYIRGNNVVAVDEEGDPMYEDVGPTPRYLALTQKYMDKYKSRSTH